MQNGHRSTLPQPFSSQRIRLTAGNRWGTLGAATRARVEMHSLQIKIEQGVRQVRQRTLLIRLGRLAS